jgi:hypothetical protein
MGLNPSAGVEDRWLLVGCVLAPGWRGGLGWLVALLPKGLWCVGIRLV